MSYKRVPANGDGNCLFQSLASASGGNLVSNIKKIRQMREKFVKFMTSAIEKESKEEITNLNMLIQSIYYEEVDGLDSRKQWRVYPKSMQIDVNTRSTKRPSDQILITQGEPVNNVDAYLKYLSIANHQMDEWFSICFMFDKKKVLHFANANNSATYGGDFIMKYIAMMFNQTLWVVSLSDGGTFLMKIAPPNSNTEKRLHLYLSGEHYEWLQRVKDDKAPTLLTNDASKTDGSPQCHFLTNCIVVRGICPLFCA